MSNRMEMLIFDIKMEGVDPIPNNNGRRGFDPEYH